VPRDAVWVPTVGTGAWLLGEVDPGTGVPVGTWRRWQPPRDMPPGALAGWEETEFAAGRRVVKREYGGVRLGPRAGLACQDGFPLAKEIRYGPGGRVMLERFFNSLSGTGVLDREIASREDGVVAHRWFHKAFVNGHSQGTGRLQRERVMRGESLLREEWFAPDGARTALVSPVTEPYRGADGEAVQVELWRALDGGQIVAEGFVRPGGDPVGPWRLLEAGGADHATADFTPLTSHTLTACCCTRAPSNGPPARRCATWWPCSRSAAKISARTC
jgi:hypothetical protein